MTAPTLRYMDDPNATLREKLKTAKALVKDGRVTEAASFLEAAANQNAGQQLQSIGNLLRRGQLSRSFRALSCLLRAERYRKEMRMLQAQFEHFARSQSAGTDADEHLSAGGRPIAATAVQGANISSKLVRLVGDRHATLKERLKASRMLINEGRVSQALSLLQVGIDQTMSDRLRTVSALRQGGELIRCVRAVECLFRPGKYRAEAEKLVDSCRELVRYEKQADAREENAADYKVRNAGSPVTVVAFTGLDRRFTVAVYFLERLLGRFGVNLIIVYDRHEAFYLAGIPGLGSNVEESCRGLKRLCDEMKTRHIICLGQSSGGYGALRYAVELNADHVLAFSPSFIGVLQEETRAEIAGRTGRLFGPEAIDFRPLYGSREAAPRITIVYGADNRYDERSVEALSAIRDTTVRPLPGVSRHGTLSEAVCQGLFFELVSDALAASGIEQMFDAIPAGSRSGRE